MAETQPQNAGPSEVKADSYVARVNQLQKPISDNLGLPIAQVPRLADDNPDTTAQEAHKLLVDITASFFAAVNRKDDEAMSEFISHGLISPNLRSSDGETILLATVRFGSVSTVRRLIALGASVNLPGRPLLPGVVADRSPLQVACVLGSTAVVKLLVEECDADDSWVAPDGALARRLAEDEGHDDIVAYLSREQRREPNRVNHAALAPLAIVVMIVYIIPRRILYDKPKQAWKNRHRFGAWCRSGLGSVWAVLAHITVLFCVMVYEAPKQAVLYCTGRRHASNGAGGSVSQA